MNWKIRSRRYFQLTSVCPRWWSNQTGRRLRILQASVIFTQTLLPMSISIHRGKNTGGLFCIGFPVSHAVGFRRKLWCSVTFLYHPHGNVNRLKCEPSLYNRNFQILKHNEQWMHIFFVVLPFQNKCRRSSPLSKSALLYL